MSEPGGIPEAGWYAILAGFLGLIGGPAAFGKAVKWWTERAGKRQKGRAEGNREWESKLVAWDAELKARETAISAQLQAGLDECRRECAAVRQESDKLREDSRVVLLALSVALPMLAHSAPGTTELSVIRTLLLSRFRVGPDIPEEMRELLAMLDQKTGGVK